MHSRIVAALACVGAVAALASTRTGVPRVHAAEGVATPELRARHGTLALDLDAVTDPRSGAPAFAYDGRRGVAPTLRLRPGDTLVVRLHNHLSAHDAYENDVNLHFHGLSVSPHAPADDAMRLAAPGETLAYRVTIPRTQQPGLFWYHSHAHGETYWQISAGLSGALIVEGLEDRLPALRSMRERVLVLRERMDVADPRAVPLFARPPAIRAAALAAMARNHRTETEGDDETGRPCSPKTGMTVTVNGAPQPARIPIAPGERQFFRVVNAAAARYFDLAVDGARLQLVALDGAPLATYPGARGVASVDHVLVAPAGRAEFVLTGTGKPATLRSRCYDTGVAGDRNPPVVLAQLERGDRHAASDAGLPLRDVTAARPAPLPSPAARRTISMTEDMQGFALDGRRYAMDDPPAIVARSGTVEEWTLVNHTDEVHDFHIHQVHFAVESVNGVPVRERHWSDTAQVPPVRYGHTTATPGTLRILVDLRNPLIRGDFVYHCHILDHEDGGMMATLRVR